MQSDASETATLKDLLGDFGVDDWEPDQADAAFEEVKGRSRRLADSYVTAAGAVLQAMDRPNGLTLPEASRVLLIAAHLSLFTGIMTNAGRFRQAGDPGGSNVYFGGLRGNHHRFTGTGPAQIGAELQAASERLQDFRRGGRAGREQARDAAVLFYADLSRIHPFYDANGRTGRFVVSVYLHIHQWLVEWRRIEAAEGKFMKRINNVNEKKTAQTDYASILLAYWRDKVVDIENLL